MRRFRIGETPIVPEPLTLGIESSCDETSAAVLRGPREVRANIVSSQVPLHQRYGGVVPEIAARAHIECIRTIIDEALDVAGVRYDDLDLIAVTDGPGLVGSLLVGLSAAKTLALALNIPLVPVDHIEAHATSACLACDEPWPAIALVVSGGHSSIYLVRDFQSIELLGQTLDDAAGEAFDKVAAILGLGFPGGPAVDRVARSGDPRAISFPRSLLNEPSFNFSFSGLKTAVLYHTYGAGRKYGSAEHLAPGQIADIAASFQAAVVEPLVHKTVTAAQRHGIGHVVVGGGVAANSALRETLTAACASAGLRLTLSPLQYCTDNAAMITALGFQHWRAGVSGSLNLEARSGLLRGAGGRVGRSTSTRR